jgi:hypothetical protein
MGMSTAEDAMYERQIGALTCHKFALVLKEFNNLKAILSRHGAHAVGLGS